MMRWLRRLFLPRSVRNSVEKIEAEIEKLTEGEMKPDYSINDTSVSWSSHLLHLAATRSMLLGEFNGTVIQSERREPVNVKHPILIPWKKTGCEEFAVVRRTGPGKPVFYYTEQGEWTRLPQGAKRFDSVSSAMYCAKQFSDCITSIDRYPIRTPCDEFASST